MGNDEQNYKKLFTYWYALIIYDLTVEFCNHWIKSWKLKEQMTGAARSGKQNIVEGSDSMRTSLKTAIKLTNVAKSSLEELLADYEDFLRQQGFKQWLQMDPQIILFRKKAGDIVRNLSNLRKFCQRPILPQDPERAGNLLLTLCHQATYLLNRQVEALENKHMKEGGYSEQLYRRRISFREENF
ncbi:MAG: four helix bundle suffix domain-containing protein [bacterium]|nr:four helix bundle suffix domain-containing protein [bacterium]